MKEKIDITVAIGSDYFVYRYFIGEESKIINMIVKQITDNYHPMTKEKANKVVDILAKISREHAK